MISRLGLCLEGLAPILWLAGQKAVGMAKAEAGPVCPGLGLLTFNVCHTRGKGRGMRCSIGTPFARKGKWSSSMPPYVSTGPPGKKDLRVPFFLSSIDDGLFPSLSSASSLPPSPSPRGISTPPSFSLFSPSTSSLYSQSVVAK